MKTTIIKFMDIKNREELKTRVKNGILSVGCHWPQISKFVSKKPFPDCQKITVIYSPGYGGTAEITRYI
jgi:hypothetical protein